MQIIEIGLSSQYLASIKALWRANSKTLGYFPDGAFDEHASKGWIIASVDDSGTLVGYLLFRLVRRGKIWPEIIIVHLCVDEHYRNQQIARKLVAHIRDKTKADHLGIRLWCRRDYDAHVFWPKVGFIPVNERVGRSGERLTFWWMDFNRPTLFNQPYADRKIQAVIDTNVFCDLQDEESIKTEESKALLADWLSDEVILSITDELFNEIDRNSDPNQRERRRGFANGFKHIRTEPMKVDEISAILSTILPPSQQRQDTSDLKQLAHAIAGGVNFFITRDQQLLGKAEDIEEQLAIKVISPGFFIGQLDEILREAEYLPKNLASTNIISTKIRATDHTELEQAFLCSSAGEKGSGFSKKIKSYVSNPTRYNAQIVRGPGNLPLALIVYDTNLASELQIPLLRVARHQLSGTITRHMLHKAILYSAEKGIALTNITDDFIQNGLSEALVESGFSHVSGIWVKVNLPYARNKVDLLRILADLRSQYPRIENFLDEYKNLLEKTQLDDTLTLAEAEKALWPLKILDSQIPTFIIPIKATWAQNLFDERLAAQTLWGADPETMLRTENIYYRSRAFGSKISAPARILWYVSAHPKMPYTKCIRACSTLDEVIVGPAKALFKRFKRLGVYRWEHIVDVAGNNPERNIMALRFSRTEQFPNPVKLSQLKTLYQMHDVGQNFSLRSPLPISSYTFAQIYESGFRRANI